jgi:hypothetical protein
MCCTDFVTVCHSDVNMMLFGELTVPVLITIEVAEPINGDGVFLLNFIDEVMSVVFVSVLDTKIINNQPEGNWRTQMWVKSSGVLDYWMYPLLSRATINLTL